MHYLNNNNYKLLLYITTRKIRMNIQSSYILPVDPRRSAPGAATSQTKKDSQIKI